MHKFSDTTLALVVLLGSDKIKKKTCLNFLDKMSLAATELVHVPISSENKDTFFLDQQSTHRLFFSKQNDSHT